MGTPNKFNQLLIRSPKYSIFDISNDSKFTMPIGKVVPANHGYELMPGEEIDINLQQLTRFMPTLSPVMQRYVLDFIPIFVPYRLLWSENAPIWNAEKFFNPATPDDERPAIPNATLYSLLDNGDHKIFGSIFDYLGYPTCTHIYDAMLRSILVSSDSESSGDKPFEIMFDWNNRLMRFSIMKIIVDAEENTVTFTDMQDQSRNIYTFYTWMLEKVFDGLGTAINDDIVNGWTSWDDMVRSIGGSNKFSSLVDDYLNYLFGRVYRSVYGNTANADIRLLPWLCYHKAYSDWFLNTNLVDPDEYMRDLNYVYTNLLHRGQPLSLGMQAPDLSFNYISILSGSPCPRMWMDDYFTTAYTSAQNGSAVQIPANGTIPQLRIANRLQEFRERVILTGKRYIDQIKTLWGVQVPDMRLQRSEVLGHLKFNLVVSDVLQTSQSEIDSSLGQMAGQLTSSNGGHLLHYKADEPGYLLVMCSVRPTTAYVDQCPRIIFKKDFYDFENPMFDNVGMQEILNKELYYSPYGQINIGVFGYAPRRYAEYMSNFNEVHGQFKTSLDYWHAGRKFSELPALNSEFVTMQPSDGLDRVFADQSGDQVLCQVYFDAKVTRPLSRYINYHM